MLIWISERLCPRRQLKTGIGRGPSPENRQFFNEVHGRMRRTGRLSPPGLTGWSWMIFCRLVGVPDLQRNAGPDTQTRWPPEVWIIR